MSSAHLVIGGDGLIGRHLFRGIRTRGYRVLRTSRRYGSEGPAVHFDLDSPPEDLLEQLRVNGWFKNRALVAYIAAAVPGFDRCEQEPETTRNINVCYTIEIARHLAENKVFLVFLSSDAVFGHKQCVVDEETIPQPGTEYGKQKLMAETGLLNLAQTPECPGVAIVRLTKVVSADAPLIDTWLRTLEGGGEIEAFDDMYIAPVSIQYSVRALMAIGVSRYPGIFHVTGEGDVSYYEFARMLADRWIGTTGLVKAVSFESRVAPNLGYRREVMALSTRRATEIAALVPQPVTQVVNDIVTMAQSRSVR